MSGGALLSAWERGLQRRQPLLDERDVLRLLHDEDPQVRCDRYGDVCWFYWYGDGPPGADDLNGFAALTATVGAGHWHARAMRNQAHQPEEVNLWSSSRAPVEWVVSEDEIRYQLSSERGQSPGLFLDQRDNRRWVHDHAPDGEILNLFAYTGSFAFAALRGGARGSVNVDVSQRYLAWTEGNAGINGLAGRVETAAVDARRFLAGSARRGRTFDAIVCDPPSFSRPRKREESVFQVERDLPPLVTAGLEVLNPGGWMLVSSNYEGWSAEQFRCAVQRGARGRAELMNAPGSGADFEAACELTLLKSAILRC
ncbi:MAG: class I SAM-dependent methyltransferase [Candidatus Latescibacterota bacterium]|nr:class I SAM-dependent methyltransferase [Candidatus Latescibacterota bacterium]